MTGPLAALRSVRRKLVAAVLLTSLAALAICGASLFVYDLSTYRDSSAEALAIEARLLGHATTAAMQFNDASVATQNLAFLQARPSVRVAAIYNPRGALFARYVRGDASAAEIPPLPESEGAVIQGDRVTVFHRIVQDKEILGTVFLAEDLGLAKRVGSYAAIALGAMLAGLAVAALLSTWLQRHITGPVIEVSELARRVVETRDYGLRARRTTSDEIGTLVDAFNEMLAEIQARTLALESSSEEVGRLNKDLERRVGERTAQLERSNLQLRDASHAKSSFLSMMSHEIRTPMNGLLGMLELLSLSSLGAHQRTTLEIVRESGRALMRIIDDILDFSKIEAGKLEIRPETASIERIVAGVAAVYSGNASAKGLQLLTEVDPRISPAVLVDQLRLQQILNNLVNNAIKFTSNGRVEVRAELVERRADEDVVRFSVSDTGIGISPEAQAALFQPFVQAGAETARTFGGTGLGLSIAERLAKMMGGTMKLESQPGQGTTAILTLPLPVADAAQLAGAGPRREGPAESLLAKRRDAPGVAQAEKEGSLVLVVDDHPINRLVLQRQVSILGYANEEASDGREALEMWKSGRHALVITDCNMPGMDGYQLTRNIRAMEQRMGRRRTTIIACTANALKGEAEHCFEAGMDDYLVKPVELSKLLVKLDQWLPIPARRGDESAAASHSPVAASAVALVSGGDASIERAMYAKLLETNAGDIATFKEGVAARDAELVGNAAHRIRGASSAVGASALAEVAARLEAAALQGDWESIVAGEGVLLRELERLAQYVEQRA